jgi:HSP20 family protein
MKTQVIAGIAVVLAILLGIQTYMVFKLNDKLDQLSGHEDQAGQALKPFNLPTPKRDLGDLFSKDHPWNPYEEMQRVQNEMEQIFGESFSRFHMNVPLGSLNKTPDVDLQEKPDRYIVTVNVPGADESSLDVKLEDRTLHISIKTEHTKDQTDEENDGDFKYRERFFGEFQRVLTLPGPANASKMKTDYRNGVLTVTIPKQ